MLIQGQVGPTSTQSAAPGSTPTMRMGQLGDVVVSELHGRFYEQTYRGSLFSGGISALTSISAATITNHAIPIEILIPVRIVGAAAGRITKNAFRNGDTSKVFATFNSSLRTLATPNAVLSSIGHTEHIKMTKIPEIDESLIVYSAMGIHANGEIGFRICINGLKAAYANGDIPIKNPKGIATSIASKKPSPTRAKEKAN